MLYPKLKNIRIKIYEQENLRKANQKIFGIIISMMY